MVDGEHVMLPCKTRPNNVLSHVSENIEAARAGLGTGEIGRHSECAAGLNIVLCKRFQFGSPNRPILDASAKLGCKRRWIRFVSAYSVRCHYDCLFVRLVYG
jgi:hypothetical protein